jgi:hypothetical protein
MHPADHTERRRCILGTPEIEYLWPDYADLLELSHKARYRMETITDRDIHDAWEILAMIESNVLGLLPH